MQSEDAALGKFFLVVWVYLIARRSQGRIGYE